jgi:hypothetical protein
MAKLSMPVVWTQVVWKGYISTMQSVGFNSTTRVYVASGMLTYGASGVQPGWCLKRAIRVMSLRGHAESSGM